MWRILTVGFLCVFPAGFNNAEQIGHTDQTIVESESFLVRSYRAGPDAHDILEMCQSIRTQVHTKWFGDTPRSAWQPCCHVVLHPTRASYLQAAGRGAGRTSGSSLVRFEKGKVVERRIDLLVDGNARVTALPHELTHVVLADTFSGKQPPLWVDEGFAMLADSPTKQSLHHQDCLSALGHGTALRLTALLRMKQFTSSQEIPAFYGQSLSLVRYLTEKHDPSQLMPFLALAEEKGYDAALRVVYKIDGLGKLEVLWRDYAVSCSPPF